jgi:UDP-N-acetylmuramoylalanine--D-glutamate ligase
MADLPIVLYGAGREALSTRRFLAARQSDRKVFVTVDSGASDIPDTEPLPPDALERAIATRSIGLIVKSPGVSLYKPLFAAARTAGISITSNLNLWGQTYRQGRTVIAISGTKGKSTTATLAHLMLVSSGLDAGLAGNVGVAPLDIADKYPIVVLELSSYQTADMEFLPDFAGLTNLSPEHVDWHGNVARYYADKLNLFSRPGPVAIALGAPAHANAIVLDAVGDRARLLPFLPTDIVAAIDAAIPGSRLKGAHNRDNAMLAAQLALAGGASRDGIVAGVTRFTPLPHRLEEHVIGRKTFVDDSISTTPEATKAALAAYGGCRIALILGGHEREQDYADLITRLEHAGVTTVIGLPITGERAIAALAGHSGIVAEMAPDLAAAMQRLKTLSDRFDTLILSPGAPSYNQFKNFEERGDTFVALAKTLFG